MNENMTIDMERDQDNGQITYANDVIATIVSVATGEVEGISGIAGAASISGILAKGRTPRGVKVDMKDDSVEVDVSVTVDYGTPIQKVGRNAQENVRKSVESMTGLRVDKVDVHVVGVSFEKEQQEMQESQKLAQSIESAVEEQPAEESVVKTEEEVLPVEDELEPDELDEEEEEEASFDEEEEDETETEKESDEE